MLPLPVPVQLVVNEVPKYGAILISMYLSPENFEPLILEIFKLLNRFKALVLDEPINGLELVKFELKLRFWLPETVPHVPFNELPSFSKNFGQHVETKKRSKMS